MSESLRRERLPAVLVDLDAFDRNAATLFARLPDGVTLRPATKSLRVPALLERLRTLGGAKVRGWMTFSAAETEHLADAGFDDFLLAYPVAEPADAEFLQHLVAPHRGTDLLRRRGFVVESPPLAGPGERLRLLMRGEQGFETLAQVRVALAFGVQKCGAFLRRLFHRQGEQVFFAGWVHVVRV